LCPSHFKTIPAREKEEVLELKLFKDEQAPFPLSPNTILTKVVKIEQREIRDEGFVLTISEGIRGGSLKQSQRLVKETEADAQHEVNKIVDEFSKLGFSSILKER